MKKQCNLLILLVLIPFFGFATATDYSHSKQKTIKKTYIVNPDVDLDVSNSYGNITVTTWDEDKIELDIFIKVSGDNENWVNQRLDDIDVNITALKGLITAKTVINSNNNSNGKNNSFEINYTIKIPKNGSIKLNNKYGNIVTTDLISSTDINCKYGKVILGKLNGNSNTIQIDYCSNSSIDYIKAGIINSKYSGLTINEAGKLNLNANYTDVVIANCGELNYAFKYGNLKIDKLKSVTGNGRYTNIKLGEILNKLNLDTGYGNISVNSINENANDITIVSSYSTITLGYQANYAFDFNIALRYADFNNKNDLEVYNKSDEHNSKTYQGFNKKRGVNKVTINSNYGNVVLSKKQ